MKVTISALQQHAIANSLFSPTTLLRAIRRMGFVQADPIRSPARAQDLILRHRVKSYHAGDLERKYPKLDLEEDFLYAYGFLPRSNWRLLHPRTESELSAPEQRVLEIVSTHRRLHPRELESYLGRERQVNPWGGYSKATTRTLHALHHRGLLRVAGRENGIRVYEPNRQELIGEDVAERLRRLTLLIAGILAPVSVRSLNGALFLLSYSVTLPGRKSIVANLVRSGELSHADVDGFRYVWPAGKLLRREPENAVRFLAPFDPLVWDRRRFEHLWGWAYRFEAYTPAAKRKMGYYAMPLLWRNAAIGWVNVSKRGAAIECATGFVNGTPRERTFRTAFEEETARISTFLQ